MALAGLKKSRTTFELYIIEFIEIYQISQEYAILTRIVTHTDDARAEQKQNAFLALFDSSFYGYAMFLFNNKKQDNSAILAKSQISQENGNPFENHDAVYSWCI